jgi:hypothetical protein
LTFFLRRVGHTGEGLTSDSGGAELLDRG